MKGGSGGDIYTFTDISHSNSTNGVDLILGWNAMEGDKIDLSGLGFSDLLQGQGNAEGTALTYWHQYNDTYISNADDSFKLRVAD